MAPARRAWNATSVEPRPGRRSTVNPRASRCWASISANRYDSANGFDATVMGGPDRAAPAARCAAA